MCIDTVTRYLDGGGVGLPASSLCIIRRLYYIAKLQSLSQDRKEVKFNLSNRHVLSQSVQKWREICTDLLIGVGFPCVVMTLGEFLPCFINVVAF